jgi:ABC-type enterochelin transport system substrate-binding protein
LGFVNDGALDRQLDTTQVLQDNHECALCDCDALIKIDHLGVEHSNMAPAKMIPATIVTT